MSAPGAVGDFTVEGIEEADTKNFSVRSYLKQLTPVLAEALTAMEKEECAAAAARLPYGPASSGTMTRARPTPARGARRYCHLTLTRTAPSRCAARMSPSSGSRNISTTTEHGTRECPTGRYESHGPLWVRNHCSRHRSRHRPRGPASFGSVSYLRTA